MSIPPNPGSAVVAPTGSVSFGSATSHKVPEDAAQQDLYAPGAPPDKALCKPQEFLRVAAPGTPQSLSLAYGQADRSVSKFVDSMTESSESFVSPLQTQRISGQFKLRGESGNVFNVTFVGSTHEWIQQGDVSVASGQESEFIDKYLFDPARKANRTLLVEQGTSAAENRLAGFIRRNEKDNPKLLSYLDWRTKGEDRLTELPAACVKALDSGARVSNMDLLYGEDFFKFYLNNGGEDSAVKAACHAMYSLQLSPAQALGTIEKMIEVNGLAQQVDLGSVRNTVNDYYPRLLSDDFVASDLRNEIAPDQLRNQYMAGKVYQQNSDVCILSHTAHIVGILNALKGNITEFEVFSEELSMPAEERLKKLSTTVRKEVNGEFRQRIAGSISPLTVQP